MSKLIDEIVEEAKAGFELVTDFVKGEAQKVVIVAANTDFGTTVLNLMSAAESKQLSGTEKMAEVVAGGVHLATEFLALGGWSGVFAAAEHFVEGVAQLLFADFAKRMDELRAGQAG